MRHALRVLSFLAFVVGGLSVAHADCINVPHDPVHPNWNDVTSMCDLTPKIGKPFHDDLSRAHGGKVDTFVFMLKKDYPQVAPNCQTGDVLEVSVGSFEFQPRVFFLDYTAAGLERQNWVQYALARGYDQKLTDQSTGRPVYWTTAIVKCPVTVSGVPVMRILPALDPPFDEYNSGFTVQVTVWRGSSSGGGGGGGCPPGTHETGGGLFGQSDCQPN